MPFLPIDGFASRYNSLSVSHCSWSALQSLIIFQTLAKAEVVLNMDIFKGQMTKWLAALPSYFKMRKWEN